MFLSYKFLSNRAVNILLEVIFLKKKNYDAQAGIMGHILNDFRGNVRRQNVLQNVSLLHFPF